jgi:2-methylcitrate dehydratase PrpD
LTLGLGHEFQSRTIMLKRFACHITAHTAVEAIINLRAQHGFSGTDVASVQIEGSRRMATVNNIPKPDDILIAQFSIPFCAALALYRNAIDPYSFDEGATRDAAIMAMAAQVKMTAAPGEADDAIASTVTITLKDGRVLTQHVTEFLGTPGRPLTGKDMREKFMLLTQKYPATQMAQFYDRLQNLEKEANLEWLHV